MEEPNKRKLSPETPTAKQVKKISLHSLNENIDDLDKINQLLNEIANEDSHKNNS